MAELHGDEPPVNIDGKAFHDFDNIDRVQQLLETRLERDEIAQRPQAGGQVSYIEAWRVIEKAQQIFGFNGWSSRIIDISKEFEEQVAGSGRWSVGFGCVIRVTLKDGTFHDDVGFGSVMNEKDRGKAIENARKEAVSDGVKRSLRYFGAALGNCIYDKAHLKAASAAGKRPVGALTDAAAAPHAPQPLGCHNGPNGGGAPSAMAMPALAPTPAPVQSMAAPSAHAMATVTGTGWQQPQPQQQQPQQQQPMQPQQPPLQQPPYTGVPAAATDTGVHASLSAHGRQSAPAPAAAASAARPLPPYGAPAAAAPMGSGLEPPAKRLCSALAPSNPSYAAQQWAPQLPQQQPPQQQQQPQPQQPQQQPPQQPPQQPQQQQPQQQQPQQQQPQQQQPQQPQQQVQPPPQPSAQQPPQPYPHSYQQAQPVPVWRPPSHGWQPPVNPPQPALLQGAPGTCQPPAGAPALPGAGNCGSAPLPQIRVAATSQPGKQVGTPPPLPQAPPR